MSKKFEKNLELWAKERPLEALRLQYGSHPLPPWELYAGDPQKEAREWFKELPLESAKVLYVYGIGLGAYYHPLKKWLKKDPERLVIFLEDEKGVLQHFFKTALATKILQDPQVILSSLEEGALDTLYWSTVLTPFAIGALPSYQKHKPFEDLKYKIAYETTKKNGLVEEYLKYGAAFSRNFYLNMLHLNGAYWGNALFGKFQGVPAIICGAGPSLDKQLEKLEALKGKALIFAGGSALNALASKGLVPHFGAGIDPNPTQALRLHASQGKVPFFFRTRMHAEAVQKISGPRLYISGVGGYDVAEWYEKHLGLEAEFLDEGHNVVNFCTEIAARMGCNPLIYVGVDLAFTGMKTYAEGVEENTSVILNPQNEEERGIYRTDIFGKPVLTLWKWVAEAEWLGSFAKEHPACTIINATEGGIGIPNVPNQTLASIRLKKAHFDIQKAIQEAALPQATQEALLKYTLELKESLEQCQKLIIHLMKELDREKERADTTGALTSGKVALLESDLYEQPGYMYVLAIFHQVFVRVQNKRAVQIRLNKGEADPRALALQKLDLHKEKLIFLNQVAEANILLIEYAIKNK